MSRNKAAAVAPTATAVPTLPGTTPLEADSDRCGNCQYYRAADQEKGYCRRYPPVIVGTPTDIGPLTLHPVVRYDSLCGEHKAASR